MKTHQYRTTLRWTGNTGEETATYASYSRNHEISGAGKAITLPASSDTHFRGEGSRYNPEELLVAALSSCHMLAYLHLCAVNKVIVLEYKDNATGTMVENPDGSGQLTEATLNPVVKVKDSSMNVKALELH